LSRAPTAGEVRVGCPETLAAGFLPAFIEQFSRTYPKVVFHVIQANTVTLQFEELRSRTVDVVLARLSRPLAEEDLKSETFFDDHLVVVAGAHNKWTRRRLTPMVSRFIDAIRDARHSVPSPRK
jgi:DNA-binding transcriptional LysR family regulator